MKKPTTMLDDPHQQFVHQCSPDQGPTFRIYPNVH